MNIEDMKPMNGRLLIEVLPEEEKYKGSLHLATASKEKSNFGIVKQVYKSYNGKEPMVKVGDIVVFPLHTGSIFTSGDMLTPEEERKEFRVIREDELLGTFEC